MGLLDEACAHLQARCGQVCQGLRDLVSHLEGLQTAADGEAAHRRQAERSSRIIDAILESSPMPLVILDPEAKVERWSPAASEAFGWSEAEACRRTLPSLMGEGLEGLYDPCRSPSEENPVRGVETAATGKGPLASRVAVFASAIQGDDDRLGGMAVFFEDLNKRADAALEFAAHRRDEFLTVLAHELRNTMAPVLSGAEVISLPQVDEETRRQACESIATHVGYMARLMEELLDLGRMCRGQLDLQMQPVDLSVPVAAACEAVQPLMLERRHVLEVAAPSMELMVRGDPMRLEQILTNLLQNAAKYTDPGGQVWLSAERVGEDAVIRVRDSGRGLGPEVIGRLFEPYFQAERGRGLMGGVGLGLTLVRRLVGLHQGQIEVHSPGAGKGSQFTVRLPLLRR